MAFFNVTNTSYENLAPTVVGNITINITYATAQHIFTVADFTTLTTPVYSDPENDSAETVKIVTIPTVGLLKLSSIDVSPNDEISVVDIAAGNLTYNIDLGDTDSYIDSDMTFNVADNGSFSYGAIVEGIVTISVGAEINLPPDNVGDNTINLDYNEFYTFTRANFTTETTPAYSDPEADAENNLKILSLPINGTIKIDGVVASVNNVVSFANIDLGKLTYVPNVSIITAQTITFGFSISDAGSGQYSA